MPNKEKPNPQQYVVERNGRYLTINSIWSRLAADAYRFDTKAGAETFAADYDGARAVPAKETDNA